jgi:predicted acylesterase/phospholipase RssA
MDLTNWDIDFDYPSSASLSDFRLADSLVISGGGMKGIYALGSLQYLYDEVGFTHLQAYYGVSIGAVICVLLLIGYTPVEVMAYICANKLPQKIAVLDKNIVERKSLFNPKHFVELLEEMISKKLGTVPTLSEFYQLTQIDLYIVTICLSTPFSPVYLHHSSHPDLLLSHAVHMSMSIPFAFGYAEYEGKKYIDGGMIDNFPIHYAAQHSKKPFGICFSNDTEPFEEGNFMNEVLFVIMLPISYITERAKKTCPKEVTYIELKTGENVSGFMAFERQNGAIYDMFAKGYHECKQILSNKEKKD